MLMTDHNICGAGNIVRDIIGAVLVNIERDGRVARCLLYFCSNEQTRVLSQTTLTQRGMIRANFDEG